MKEVLPYEDSGAGKKEQVSQMFDNISPKYDLLNHLLSMGIDVSWRKRVVRLLSKEKPESILDIATGTADLAIMMTKTGAKKITGTDISAGMLSVGQQKIERRGLTGQITLQQADAENLPFADNSFDAVTAAFGVRNFENLGKGLSEMRRVLRPGGTLAILEFSQPEMFPFKQAYFFYFKNILPLIGRMVSKESRAYTYLPESVSAFPYGERFLRLLQEHGYQQAHQKKLTFGVATIYIAKK
jgi:demethylmenaquinone methyltransferase/2-methoxy-6-polyprenyl-1,4-benzoquinol methylase